MKYCIYDKFICFQKGFHNIQFHQIILIDNTEIVMFIVYLYKHFINMLM